MISHVGQASSLSPIRLLSVLLIGCAMLGSVGCVECCDENCTMGAHASMLREGMPAWQPTAAPVWQPSAVMESDTALQVNTVALSEPKSGPPGYCPTCPQQRSPAPAVIAPQWSGQPVYRSPGLPYGIRLRPGETLLSVGPARVVSPSTSRPSTMPAVPSQNVRRPDCPDGNCPLLRPTYSTAEPREGVFACEKCKRATVGEAWHELWSDDGTPLTFLCRRCWSASQPAERRQLLESYMERSGLSPAQRFYGRAAISAAISSDVRDQ